MYVVLLQADAVQSILKIDNTDIDGFTISVALSCPPENKAPAIPHKPANFTPTLRGGNKECTDRGVEGTLYLPLNSL